MSTYDITKMYKEAKDKRAQIDILADMNLCTTKEIREELIKGGIPFQTLPRKSRKEKYTVKFDPVKGVVPVLPGVTNDEPAVTCKNEEKVQVSNEEAPSVPQSVYRAVEKELFVLDAMKKEYEKKLQAVYAEIADLEAFMAKRKAAPSEDSATRSE